MNGRRGRNGGIGGLTVSSFLVEQERKRAQSEGSAGPAWNVQTEQPAQTEGRDNSQRSDLTDDKLHAVIEVASVLSYKYIE